MTKETIELAKEITELKKLFKMDCGFDSKLATPDINKYAALYRGISIAEELLDLIQQYQRPIITGDISLEDLDGLDMTSEEIIQFYPKQEQQGWQDISTAPKDGTVLILHEKHPMTGESSVYEGYYYKTEKSYDDAWYDA